MPDGSENDVDHSIFGCVIVSWETKLWNDASSSGKSQVCVDERNEGIYHEGLISNVPSVLSHSLHEVDECLLQFEDIAGLGQAVLPRLQSILIESGHLVRSIHEMRDLQGSVARQTIQKTTELGFKSFQYGIQVEASVISSCFKAKFR